MKGLQCDTWPSACGSGPRELCHGDGNKRHHNILRFSLLGPKHNGSGMCFFNLFEIRELNSEGAAWIGLIRCLGNGTSGKVSFLFGWLCMGSALGRITRGMNAESAQTHVTWWATMMLCCPIFQMRHSRFLLKSDILKCERKWKRLLKYIGGWDMIFCILHYLKTLRTWKFEDVYILTI